MREDKPFVRAGFDAWAGVVSASNPHTIGIGFQQAINVNTNVAAELGVRQGIRVVSFTGAGSADAYNVGVVYSLNRAEQDWIIYADTNGNIKAGKISSSLT